MASIQAALIGSLPIGLPQRCINEEVHEQDVSCLSLHNDLLHSQRYIDRVPRCHLTYFLDDEKNGGMSTSAGTDLVVVRNEINGQLLEVTESVIAGETTSKQSMSLRRPPCVSKDGIWGSSNSYPFWPGGLDEPNLDELTSAAGGCDQRVDFENDLLIVPPGFAKGMIFEQKRPQTDLLTRKTTTATRINFADILGQEIDLGDDLEVVVDNTTAAKTTNGTPLINQSTDSNQATDAREEGSKAKTDKSEAVSVDDWAVRLDTHTPVVDFHQRIPDPAQQYAFELDTFQKQAILYLESGQSVFVAAHTSAGKTVIAEYAIALCLRHMTKAVYTSPIKALSNQKFRDFKEKFSDVGLVTGDVQIKPDAACLIMTTEILRSMLYSGSDVIRDLEWVIFDEVHYINDAERGVVWEEVLIMLPKHVHIVMLSATVPNTMEFARWVGRIKRQKIYVASTLHRPIPLEHYLYTGNSQKTSNELFLVLDSTGTFSKLAHQKAIDAKKARESKSSQTTGPKVVRQSFNPAQDKNIWLSVINMLEKRDKLPAVAFTFSKKRIEENSAHLNSIDLTTGGEKAMILVFFKKSIERLKEVDRKLPQIIQLESLLKRGIGIHHSGVLPILKEVVEMLFQRGLVKILFATETFAMGVNMPARTVVFDTTKKHDGTGMRDLLPGEYIQMAGRAGRRGLDTTGTVIILCKVDPPPLDELHKMMMSKPTLLESKFRVTYSMILNLLRVRGKGLRVEDMMKHSFSETAAQTDVPRLQRRLGEVLSKVEEMKEEMNHVGRDLQEYYKGCEEYWVLEQSLQSKVYTQHQGLKTLTPGRVVVISQLYRQSNLLSVILGAPSAASKDRSFKTLVLCSEDDLRSDLNTSSSSSPSSFSSHAKGQPSSHCDDEMPRPVLETLLYRPAGRCTHDVININLDNIAAISSKTLKLNADEILKDFNRRQTGKFRSDPPEKCTILATQELLRLVESNPSGLPSLDPVKDLHINDVDTVQDFNRLKHLRQTLPLCICIHDTSFDNDFVTMRKYNKLTAEESTLRRALSDDSLTMLPDYQHMVEVLRKLDYIDADGVIQLKGRIACEIGNHELMITELIFNNILSGLHPTEIAALLSCTVFEQKRCSEPQLSKELKTCKARFEALAKDLAEVQRACKVAVSAEDFLDQFHFGLVEVVFEWARGMPFSSIMKLTDVQEGIIVRCIQRLNELLRDVRKAAYLIGDPVLTQKMDDASIAIKRDIVFSASLYTQ